MLKFLQYRNEVEELVIELSKTQLLKSFKVGFTGSYANMENKDSSAIDIILKLREDEDKKKIGSMDIAYFINSYMHDIYSNKVKIIWYDLLEKNEEDIKKYQAEGGIEGNPASPYLSIVDNIVWADDIVVSDDEGDKSESENEDSLEDENASNESLFIKTFNIDEEDDSEYEPDENGEDGEMEEEE